MPLDWKINGGGNSQRIILDKESYRARPVFIVLLKKEPKGTGNLGSRAQMISEGRMEGNWKGRRLLRRSKGEWENGSKFIVSLPNQTISYEETKQTGY